MTTGNTDRLAVLIDADNVPAKHAAEIFEEIATLGEAGLRRIYGDFSNGSPQGWDAKSLAEYAIVPHQQFANTTGKNSSDIALVIDAMDILHTGRFSGFVLVSSDSDFTRLASRVREQGLDVFGIGERKAPKAFVAACNRFIYIENIEKMAEVDQSSEKSNGQPGKQSLNHAYQLIRNVVLTTNNPDGWATLPFVERQLGKIYPDFDSRSYGFKSTRDLVREVGRFDEADANGYFKIRCRDS
ncbi:NYN domain-containing protein [Rhodobacteraceae bacterium B1Z28]|uniref:NYN domain-containing protein n=1 Tax=Ruegeria haliotis TaxID=2747601 RepID=A0ABX2PPM8_9RHOB|nr:NYN domain-containing protein [Ruegeria haliotis]NVO56080.1 NYN domain-containing protein [Ruegeria haliotis]